MCENLYVQKFDLHRIFKHCKLNRTVKKSFRKQWPNGLYGVARTLNSASHPVKKGRALYSSVDSPSREKGFLCSLCCFLISADIGGPVARGKAPFLCSFLGIEISKFRNDLLLFFFVVS